MEPVRPPTDDEISAAYAQGEEAVIKLFHETIGRLAGGMQRLEDQLPQLQESVGKLADGMQRLEDQLANSSSSPRSSDGLQKIHRPIWGIGDRAAEQMRRLAGGLKRRRGLSAAWILAIERRISQPPIRALLLATGLALAIVGQVILVRTNGAMADEGRRQFLAGLLLIAGALSFGFAARRSQPPPARLDFPPGQVSAPPLDWRNPWTLGWSGAALLLAVVDISLFLRGGEDSTVVIMWLTSIVALFMAQLPGGLALPRIVREEGWYLVGLAAVLLIALASRSYQLTTLPYDLDGDFAAVGLQARALATGAQEQIFAYGWADIPMLGYLPPWITMKLFGDGLAGLNASGVAEGLLILVGVYLLGRDLYHARVGLIAAALLMVAEAFLAASRQSVYIDPLFFMVFALYFLLIGLRESRGWAIVASGAFTALCFQMYYSGRLLVPVAGFIFLFLALFHRRWLVARWWAVLLWVLAILIALGPMMVVFARHPGGLASRSRSVFILDSEVVRHAKDVYGVSTIPEVLHEQARRSLLLFNYYPDKGTQFGIRRPLLDPYLGILFVLGLGCALFAPRRIGNALLLFWIFVGIVLGSFLTVNAPFWPRLMVLLPPAALLSALALDVLYEEATQALKPAGRPAAVVMAVVVSLFILGVGRSNWDAYIADKASYATTRTRIGRYLAEQSPSTRAYLITNDFTYRDREFEFLAPGRLIANLAPDQISADIERIGQPTLLILTREQEPLLAQLRQLYPVVSLKAHAGNSPGEIAFYSVQLP